MMGPVGPRIKRDSFGPFSKGVISSANPLLGLDNSLRSGKNVTLQGVTQLLARKGTVPVMTFMDDQGTAAFVTSIRAVQPFKDRALVIAHSTVTNKVYYYLCASDFSGWYASASDAFVTSLSSDGRAQPMGVVWSSITAPPDVSVAEGLGVLFIAHTTAADASALNWPTKRVYYNVGALAWQIASLTSDLNADSSAETLYFSGLLSFQQHLWGWGFGSGTSAGGTLPTTAPAYDPSKLRFSGPIFTNSDGTTLADFFSASDSLTEGDRVQSEREKIIAGAVAGNAGLFFGRNNITRVTGYGRDSWVKEVVDRTYGLIGPKAVTSDGTTVYFWSNRGPARVGATGPIDPLWDPIVEASTAAIQGGQPASIVAGFARDLDQVQFFYATDTTAGLVKFCAFDIRREVWLGPDSAIGVEVGCAGAIEPVYTVASPPGPPAGPPVLAAASGVAAQQFTINWASGDNTATTEVYYSLHSTPGAWTMAQTVQAGVLTYTLTGLAPSTGYDVQVRHVKNGQYSAYSTSTTPYAQTSAFVCLAPTSCLMVSEGPPDTPTSATARVTWHNTQSTASTEVYIAGPSASAPAAGSYSKYGTVASGGSSYTVGPVSTTGKYWAKVRHIQTGYDPSGYSNVASDTLYSFSGIH